MFLRSANDNGARFDIQLEVDAYMPWSGGSRTYYHNLYRRLVADFGCEVVVNTSHCEGENEFDKSWAGSRLHINRRYRRLPDWKAKRAPVLARKVMRSFVDTIKIAPAAIHCGDLFPQAFAGSAIRRLTGLPLLVFVHGDEISQTQGRRLQPHVRDAVYRSADAIVAANSYAYREVAGILQSTDRLTMITPGVDLERFRPDSAPDWVRSKYLLGQGPLVLTVGRLVKKKGHATVLRCLPQVIKEFPALHYLIVGNGPERSSLMELSNRLGLSARVVFTGDIPHDSLGDYYRASDIFCMVNQRDRTGDIETFGMVFLEAGAVGKSVIGGRSGGTEQSIVDGKTGILCEPENSAQTAESLLLLLRNPDLRERMGTAGLQRVRQEFDWKSRAAQLFEVQQRIVRTPRAASRKGEPSCIS